MSNSHTQRGRTKTRERYLGITYLKILDYLLERKEKKRERKKGIMIITDKVFIIYVINDIASG